MDENNKLNTNIPQTEVTNLASEEVLLNVERIAAKQGIRVATKQVLLFKTMGTIIGAIMLFMLGVFGSAYIFKTSGGFTIQINGDENSTRGIALSSDASFTNSTIRISYGETVPILNTSGSWITDEVDTVDGEHHGENYLAYTFYVKNVGTESVNLNGSLSIITQVKGADDALWIRIYEDGVSNTYAKVAKDGAPEAGTIPFRSDTLAYEKVIEDFKPGQIIKYTIVLWLEGDDPECLDGIRGGLVRLQMKFNI